MCFQRIYRYSTASELVTVPFLGFRCNQNFFKPFTAPFYFPFFIIKSANPAGKYSLFSSKTAINIVQRKGNSLTFSNKKRESYRTKMKTVFQYIKESANHTVLKLKAFFVLKKNIMCYYMKFEMRFYQKHSKPSFLVKTLLNFSIVYDRG